MDTQAKKRLLRRARVTFRWVRITLWFSIFLVVAAWAYLHLIGLPDFLKRPLLARLREQGFEAQFSNARLGWGPEVVIDNGAFQCPGQPLVPRFSGETTIVRFDLKDLLHRRFKAGLLSVTQGSLELPLSKEPGDALSVNHVSMEVALLTNDTIRLQVPHATFHGMQIVIQGTITNFMAVRDWKSPAAPAASSTNHAPAATNRPPETESALRQVAEILGKINFLSPPHLSVNLGADGRDPDSLWTELSLEAGDTQTPWGQATGVRLTAACVHPLSRAAGPFLKMRLSANDLKAPQASGRNMEFTADLSRAADSNLTAVVSFAADDCKGHWLTATPTNDIEADRLYWNGRATLHPSSWTLLAASGTLRGEQVRTRWGSAADASVTCAVAATDGSPAADASWGLWTNFNHWSVDWQADLDKVTGPKINFARLQCAGAWHAPELVLTNLNAALFDGQFAGGIRLNAASRELGADVKVNFDPRLVSHLLTGSAERWMKQFDWDTPPQISAQTSLVLPDWNKPGPDWWSEVLPTLQIAGNFSIGPAAYRGLEVASAQSSFTYSNEVWNLPRLHLTRPEGDVLLDFTASDATGDFLLAGDSQIDPMIVRPLLPEKQQPLFDQVIFSGPPQIHAEVRGNWHDRAKIAFTTYLIVTNFTVRGEKIDCLADTVDFTNQVARFTEGELVQDDGELTVPLVEVDFAAKKITLSNIVSTLDPASVERGLGKLTPAWLKTLSFDSPPTVQVTGSFVPGDEKATDLHFAVSGQNFHYDRLKAGKISGKVNWVAKNVAVTNMAAQLYQGTTWGWGMFDYTVKKGTVFRGKVSMAKIQLPQLVRAFDTKPNDLAGAVDAWVAVTDGNSSDDKSWRAVGHISISQARLWDIKLFGVFSPVLNAIVPGSGNLRAYQASTDFVFTNTVLDTDNLEIRSTGFRLIYRGTLTLDKKLDARAEALLLRDTPLIGPLFSWAFTPLDKLFEYKIGGTLSKPTFKALYWSRILNDILHPFRTLKGFLPPEEPDAPPPAPATAPKNVK